MFIDDYGPEPVKPGRVEKEGDYELMIIGITSGATKENARYLRVQCKINYQGEPRVSFFLTEGKNFSGRATAMFDTFGIPRGEWNAEQWKGRRGYMHIRLREKDGFINMEPDFILNNEGWAMSPEELMARSYGDKQKSKAQDLDMYKDLPSEDLGDIPF